MPLFLRLTFTLMLIFNVNMGHAVNIKKIESNVSDSVITAKLTAKFTKNSQLNPLNISITTHHGHVTLKGHVKNKKAFVDALRLAKTTKGVLSVDAEYLEIKPNNTALTDAYITAKVETAILKAKVFNDESIPLVGINASTTDGIVTLSGVVKRQQSIIYIIKRVSAIRGVKKVISKLVVRSGA